jgi:hypothetical protein
MTCKLAAIICVFALPADAERVTVHHDPAPGAAWYARLEVRNRIGTYNDTETLDTSHGPVSVRYTTTPCSKVGDPACADTACVVAVPAGVVAVPECIDVMETKSGEVLLMEWIGG